jgi:lipoate-protein ligase A
VNAGGWHVERRVGTAAALHGRPLDGGPARRVEVLEASGPALVLGSTQPDSVVDHVAAVATGTEVARRRSGGGAVLLLPGRSTWIDVTIARGDPLWADDVAVAFHWLGETWANALRHFDIEAEVHTGGAVETPWSRRVCFAGLGAGEVTVGGRKVVGISQRRTREWARFQCGVLRVWDPVALLGLLALDDVERAQGLLALGEVAGGIDVLPERLLTAFVASLPA